MKYEQWCEERIRPIVRQYNDGAIELHEMVSAIVYNVTNNSDWERSSDEDTTEGT